MEDHSRFIATLLIWAVPTIFAIITHEVMHGVIARAFGDDTAERMGRLTLNPIPHIDPVGTILLPGILIFMHLPVFGYAKPVPVNFQRLQPPRAGDDRRRGRGTTDKFRARCHQRDPFPMVNPQPRCVVDVVSARRRGDARSVS